MSEGLVATNEILELIAVFSISLTVTESNWKAPAAQESYHAPSELPLLLP